MQGRKRTNGEGRVSYLLLILNGLACGLVVPWLIFQLAVVAAGEDVSIVTDLDYHEDANLEGLVHHFTPDPQHRLLVFFPCQQSGIIESKVREAFFGIIADADMHPLKTAGIAPRLGRDVKLGRAIRNATLTGREGYITN
jgi:hypothetical protein